MPESPAMPQHCPISERAVLAAMMRWEAVISEVLPILRVEEFYSGGHQKVFQAIVDLWEESKPVTLTTVAQLLTDRKQLSDLGGASQLAAIWDCEATGATAVYHAGVVHEKYVFRSLYHAALEIQRDSLEPVASADDALASAEGKIFALSQVGSANDVVDFSVASTEVFEFIDSKQSNSGVASGYTDLDALITGFRESELTILASRPSHGKTAIAINFARNCILRGTPLFFVSLEQSRKELVQRILCCDAKVDYQKVSMKRMSRDEVGRLIESDARLNRGLCHIDHTPNQTLYRIAANARRLKRQKAIQLIIIDYLQLIAPQNSKAPIREQVVETSRRLKLLARDLEIPVIALAQLNRGPEDRDDHRPRSSDLKESGSLEQDADLILLLTRPDKYDPNERPGELDVIVDKQRNGPTGTVTLLFQHAWMRCENIGYPNFVRGNQP